MTMTSSVPAVEFLRFFPHVHLPSLTPSGRPRFIKALANGVCKQSQTPENIREMSTGSPEVWFALSKSKPGGARARTNRFDSYPD